MEGTGMLSTISRAVLNFATSTGSLVASTVATCIGMNILAPDQYLSVIVPGRMYKDAFEESGLEAKNLSRCLEDAGTLTSPLIPWNTCGAYHAGVLGVATGTYWMFCFFNLISPLMTVFYGFLNIRIRRYSKEEMEAIKKEQSKKA